MGLDWPTALELIRRSVAHAKTIPGADLSCGVGTDQLIPSAKTTIAFAPRRTSSDLIDPMIRQWPTKSGFSTKIESLR